MKTINAFIYPTPEEFEHQMKEARRARREPFDQFLSRIFNPADHLSLDEHNPIFDEGMLRKSLSETPSIPENSVREIMNEFVWRSHDGKQYNVSDMATPHLFYSLRMIFNHTVPPVFRILRPGETMKRYPDVPHWDADYRRRAVDALTAELNQRDDLDGDLAPQFADMQANTRVILALGL